MAKKGGLGKGLSAIFIENESEDQNSTVTLKISEIDGESFSQGRFLIVPTPCAVQPIISLTAMPILASPKSIPSILILNLLYKIRIAYWR